MELSSLIDRLPSMVKVSVSVAILSFFRCKTLIQFKQSNLSFPVTKLLYDKSFDICGSFWSKINVFSFTFPSFMKFFESLWIYHRFCTGLRYKFLGIVKYLEGVSNIFLWSTIIWINLLFSSQGISLYISSPFVAWTQTYTPYILVYIANHMLSFIISNHQIF